MSLWNIFKRSTGNPSVTLPSTFRGRPIEMVNVDRLSVAELWERQPHLRTVVAFLARNIAHLGVHVFVRQDDDGRERDRTSPLYQALRAPGDNKTGYDLLFALVGDMALYDRAYWVPWWDDEGLPRIRRLPPAWVEPMSDEPFTVDYYKVTYNGTVLEIPAAEVLDFTGYSPESATAGSATIEALRETIKEQIEATKYRAQTWKRGGRVSAVLQRPADAPEWSDEAREAFREDWYASYTGNGPKAGGTPMLEDGMTLNRIDFNAQEQQFVEASKLALATVASAFFVNPTMIGLLDNANYSNVREFRKALYGETLGPWLAQIEARIDAFLLPMLDMDPARYYAEFNIKEKLQGNFEEQAAVLSSAVGRPWMVADEARALNNLPRLGGDAAELVTPLNVLVGGQASPRDSGEQNREPKAPRSGSKSRTRAPAKAATEGQREQIKRVLERFFARQGKSVLSAMGSGGDWWDGERWDRELSEDLLKVSHTLAAIIGTEAAKRLGYDDGYDPDRTVAYLGKVAERWAGNINATTKANLETAVADEDADPAEVFDTAKASRAVGTAAMVATFVAGFGTVEAAKQIAYDEGVEPTKTWETGENPRASHAAMDGETVPIDEPFSNGSMWPADGPDVDEVAGCNCRVSINF